mmetsp:Transcript_41020/g.65987  ORF Transcript_41020/g.65987 Transcript_41020/m.65987 type:complete len:369 (+) Transcript_41020:2704-3810(+)|eukprot:CAMPEP_0203785314 /NCGR_PEP_ID=MMETSP0100_2-20121128/959_1 /ASSEMBLY_ACC=CAM_ASM_000210 /TAXON_ID=96639 /ORGANISM=" , Strain NY0313808BC1" /LENGTH=368 /DNA_ID=CAMNT_0050687405 /DNA_START=38 /DNA_END=1144 /DNA_ORIENTATION=-
MTGRASRVWKSLKSGRNRDKSKFDDLKQDKRDSQNSEDASVGSCPIAEEDNAIHEDDNLSEKPHPLGPVMHSLPTPNDQEMAARNKGMEMLLERTVNVSLKRLFELFYSDDAKFGIYEFHETQQGENQVVPKWTQNEGEPAGNMGRVVTLVQPVDSPIGPPKSRVTKKQTYEYYNDELFVQTSQCHSHDVPSGSAFYLEDRLVVRPTPDGKSVIMRNYMRTVFTKSCWIKMVIMKASKANALSAYKSFSKSVSEIVAEEGQGNPPAVTKSSQVVTAIPENKQRTTQVVPLPQPCAVPTTIKAADDSTAGISTASLDTQQILMACLVCLLLALIWSNLSMRSQLRSLELSHVQVIETIRALALESPTTM